MASFFVRKFKKATKGGSDTTSGFLNSTLDILEQQYARDSGLSAAELDHLIKTAEAGIGALSTPSQQQAVRARIAAYQTQKYKIENPGRQDSAFYQSQIKNAETAIKYNFGNDPVKFLTAQAQLYDEAIAAYDQNLQDSGLAPKERAQAIAERHQLVENRNEVSGMITAINSNVEEGKKGGGKTLDSMGLVITPDANGGVANIELKPARKIRGAFRTDTTTGQNIPIYVVPNQTSDGKRRAVIGDYTFEESGGGLAGALSSLLGGQDKNVNPEDISSADTGRKVFKLTSGNFDPKVTPLDLSTISMSPTIPEGDYAVGPRGLYRRTATGYQKIDGTVGRLGIEPTRYRYIDQSIEDNVIAPQADEFLSPDGLEPEGFDAGMGELGPPKPLTVSVPSQQQPEATPEAPTSDAAPQPVPKQPTGVGRFLRRAKDIFVGNFKDDISRISGRK